MAKNIHIYSIARGYRSATVWAGSRMTKSRVATFTITPNKGLTREKRHAEIAAWLFKMFRIPGPCYLPTDATR